ncbi:MAG: hypothetical protein M0R28_07005 [Pigmentiphaga sp.]|nr:hypothetical protein [Pigmentiphaga sp.]
MLHVSDPRLDAAALTERIRRNAAQRYLPSPLIEPGPPAGPAAAAAPAAAPAPWRQRIRGWPLAGPTLAWGWRRWRRAREPGLAPIERVRALPILGDLLAWGAALATLVRWRSGLRHELARNQAELRHLQAQLARQNLELASLRRLVRREADAATPPPGSRRG